MSKLKKLLAFVMALVLIMSVTVIGSYADQKPEPLFTISNVETRQGEEFDVTISFAQDIKPDGINIAALDAVLYFDSDVFTVVQVAKGEGLNAAFSKLSNSTKLHLETGDYIYGASFKEAGTVKWSLATIDGFNFAKGTDFAVITFRANNFSNLDGDLSMTLEVTNAASSNYRDTTALYTPVTNDVKVDVNLATLCDWDFDAANKAYTLVKLNDKNATKFTIPDEYAETKELGAFPVTKIKYGAFSSLSKLETVTIGKNVKSIDSGAFFNCSNLKKLIVYSDNVTFGALTFLGSTKNLTIRCKQGSTADKFAKNNGIKVEYFEEISSCKVTGLNEEKYYNEGTPVVLSDLKLYNSYNVALKEGKDYNVEYKNNTELGTATVHITGIGEYWGERDLSFEILCPHHHEGDEYYTELKGYVNCSEGGKLVKKCTFCGLDETTDLPAKGHNISTEYVEVKAPTCQEEGIKAHKCADCDYYEDPQPIAKIPCDMQMVYEKEPTCTEEGRGQLKCTMCGKAEAYQTIPAVSHDDEGVCVWVTTKEATCDEDGEEKLTCRFCGDVIDTKTIPNKGGHLKSAEWVTVSEPTCTEDGSKQKVCVTCGKVLETQVLPKTGHTAAAEKVVIDATCEEDGSIETICATCGKTISSEAIPATGHEKSEWTVIEEASCGKEGKEGIVCIHCGKEYETKLTDALSHEEGDEWVAIKPATCTADGIEGKVCIHCGTGKVYERRIVKATGHNYQDPEIAVAPTCTEEGFQQSTCSGCGDVKIEIVPALGHNPVYVPSVLPTYRSTGVEKQVCEHCGQDYHKTRTVGKVVPDLDKNGSVSSADALMILQHATELILLEGDALKNADCNGDAKVNSTDALLVLQLATGIITAD